MVPFVCHECGSDFPTLLDLQRHNLRQHMVRRTPGVAASSDGEVEIREPLAEESEEPQTE